LWLETPRMTKRHQRECCAEDTFAFGHLSEREERGKIYGEFIGLS